MSRGRRISRVKFITPSPEIANKYLLEWENQELYYHSENFPPISKESFFNQPGLLELEIGCGTGEFLNAKAQANPSTTYVGMDISRRAIYYAVHQADKLALKNILYIKTDVKLTYPLFAPDTLYTIYLNFPDPNYGSSNLKHRIFSQRFLDAAFTGLVEKGKIIVVTDQHPFLLDMLEIADTDSRFKKSHEEPYLTTFAPIEKTRYQKAWERFKRPVFRFELMKSPQ